jgi:hypothetical protein
VHYHHARCRAALQQHQQARDAVQQAVAINPNYAEAQRLEAALS